MTLLFKFPRTLFRVKVLFCLLLATSLFIIVGMSWINLGYCKFRLSRAYENSRFGLHIFETSQKDWPCVDRMALKFDRIEDIFCIVLPDFIPYLKNPCFYDYNFNETSLRCLPYFLLIGMDKSGTTDLHGRISQHPMVMDNAGFYNKETFYWSWRRYGVHEKRFQLPRMNFNDYIDMFSNTASMIQDTNITQIITGDGTPMDLWDFRSWRTIPQNKDMKEPEVLTPHLLRHIYPRQSPKFIIQLREPIERLYSDYIFMKHGTNTTEFHNHSLQAIDMVNSCLRNHTRRICYFSDELYKALPTRLHLGCYSVFLKEWLNVFHRDSFLITTTDEYKDDLEGTLDRVFQFLDLPKLHDFKMAEIVNQTRRRVTPKKVGEILPETVEALGTFYKECNQETAEILNDDRFLWLDHYT